MPQLYIFIVALVVLVVIIWRRNHLWKIAKKLNFKKKVSERVDELRKQQQDVMPERFREKYLEEKENQKFDIAKFKDEMRQADMAMSRENWSDAQKHLINAIALAKDPVDPMFMLAEAYLKSDDMRRAETLYRRLIEEDPDSPKPYASLGKIYAKQKKFKEAIEMYARAVERDQKNDQLLVALGKLYFLLMRYSIAGECFRRAAELKPREIDYLFLLAECCEKDMDYDNALHAYERILTLEPYNEKAKDAANQMKVKINELEEAMAV